MRSPDQGSFIVAPRGGFLSYYPLLMRYLLLISLIPSLLFADVDPATVNPSENAPAPEALVAEVPAPVDPATAPHAVVVPAPVETVPVAVAEIPAPVAANEVAKDAKPSEVNTPTAEAYIPAQPKADAAADKTLVAPTAPAAETVQATPIVEEAPVDVPAVAPAVEAPKTETDASVPAEKLIELHLKPAAGSPVVLSLPESEIKKNTQDAGTFADGKKWFSVEREVTLVGYVDKKAIDKNLDIEKGTIVWTSTDKAEQLTVIDKPSDARLLDVDSMGRVEVKEPRVLYFSEAVTSAVVASAPVAETKPIVIKEAPVAPVATTVTIPASPVPAPEPVVDENTLKRRGVAVDTAPKGNLRSIEGELKKGHSLFGRKLYLVDEYGNFIAKIDKNSPIDWLTFQQYVGQTAVFVGELKETNSGLVLTVRSIRMR